MFNNQEYENTKMLKERPDLERRVRMFLDTPSHPVIKKYILAKYFKVLFSAEQECVLGSNLRNIEIRLYFINRRETTAQMFVIFVMNKLNWKGSLQSSYLHPFLLIILWFVLRIWKKTHRFILTG